MVQAAPNTSVLDDYLKDIIRGVYAACATASPHLQDPDPKVADEAIKDSEELLDVIMAGKVDEWVS